MDNNPMKPDNKLAFLTRYWLTLLLAAAVLVLLVLIVMRATQTTELASETGKTLVHEEYDQRIENPENDFKLVVDGNKLVSGPRRIVVKQNESVGIVIESKRDEIDLELPGYLITSEADPEAPGGFSFIATTKGSFDYYATDEEAEHSGDKDARAKIGTLIVE
jgi:hypothetical protein